MDLGYGYNTVSFFLISLSYLYYILSVTKKEFIKFLAMLVAALTLTVNMPSRKENLEVIPVVIFVCLPLTFIIT
jgi:hypothetical protein